MVCRYIYLPIAIDGCFLLFQRRSFIDFDLDRTELCVGFGTLLKAAFLALHSLIDEWIKQLKKPVFM